MSATAATSEAGGKNTAWVFSPVCLCIPNSPPSFIYAMRFRNERRHTERERGKWKQRGKGEKGEKEREVVERRRGEGGEGEEREGERRDR